MASSPTPPASSTGSTAAAEEAKVEDKLEGSSPGVSPDLHLDVRPAKTASTTQGFKTPTLLVLQDVSSLQIRIAQNPSPIDEDDRCKAQECTTPKSKEHRLPEAKVCPPAPRKQTSKRKRECPASGKFFVPPDLHALPDCIKALFK